MNIGIKLNGLLKVAIYGKLLGIHLNHSKEFQLADAWIWNQPDKNAKAIYSWHTEEINLLPLMKNSQLKCRAIFSGQMEIYEWS